uniref:Uncharacterized protein n=1 Tax=Tanacetum cinerariifolium TaxID=118510 RepID=A0A6L2KLX6_TANCI|nr:hypothetical protein [Tanacetum cinerariifolium]
MWVLYTKSNKITKANSESGLLLSLNETTKPTGDVSPPRNTKKQSPSVHDGADGLPAMVNSSLNFPSYDLDTGGATDEEDGGDAADALAEVE